MITLRSVLIPTVPRRWVYWGPIAEFFVCLFALAAAGAWIWVLS
jgi:hypothetical protein